MVLAIIVMSVSVFSFGFDNSVFATIQAMDGMYYVKSAVTPSLTRSFSIRKAIRHI